MQKLLLAYDGTEHSRRALELTATMARTFGAEVTMQCIGRPAAPDRCDSCDHVASDATNSAVVRRRRCIVAMSRRCDRANMRPMHAARRAATDRHAASA